MKTKQQKIIERCGGVKGAVELIGMPLRTAYNWAKGANVNKWVLALAEDALSVRVGEIEIKCASCGEVMTTKDGIVPRTCEACGISGQFRVVVDD